METFHLPLRELAIRFTRSELAIVAWRSQEQYWQFKRKTANLDSGREYEEELQQEEEPVDDEISYSGKPVDVDAIYQAIEGKTKKKKEKVLKLGRKKKKVYSGKVPQNLPDRFYNAEGDIDLRQVSGDDAFRYFAKIGMPLPVINRIDR